MRKTLKLDVQSQNFWKESIDNEMKIRHGWFMKHMKDDKKKQEAGMMTTKKPRIIQVKPKSDEPIPTIKRIPRKPKPVPVIVTEAKKEQRVVSAKTKSLLFSGLSKEGEGRAAYLLQRKVKGPEEKFEFPFTSSLEIGWDIKNRTASSELNPVHFGRSRIIQDWFFRPNGIM